MSDPEFFGKYHVKGTLGEGGMGIVYKGYDPLIARTVAIKTIRSSLLEGKIGQELLLRFKHEAQAAGRLTHPNIVAIYEYDEGKNDCCPYFIMEHVEGKELKDYLKMGVRFTFEQSLHIIEQVLDALGYAHKHGIIHRDIKPANVILLENKDIKIADFGIAKLDDSEFTQTGKVIGTPSYMSPEQCKGLHVDGRSDLYSAGLLLYELLTGKKATAVNHQGGFAQTMKGFSPNKPDTSDSKTIHIFNVIVKKALAEDPEQRFQNAEAFLEEIKKLSTQHASHKKGAPLWLFGGVFAGGLALITVLTFPLLNDDSSSHPKTQTAETTQSIPLNPPPIQKKLSQDEATKIKKLLKVAHTHQLVGRLVTPSGSNAYYSYQMVLAIDDQNTQALEGLESIANKLLKKIKSYKSNGNNATADQLTTIGKRLYPNKTEF